MFEWSVLSFLQKWPLEEFENFGSEWYYRLYFPVKNKISEIFLLAKSTSQFSFKMTCLDKSDVFKLLFRRCSSFVEEFSPGNIKLVWAPTSHFGTCWNLWSSFWNFSALVSVDLAVSMWNSIWSFISFSFSWNCLRSSFRCFRISIIFALASAIWAPISAWRDSSSDL